LKKWQNLVRVWI